MYLANLLITLVDASQKDLYGNNLPVHTYPVQIYLVESQQKLIGFTNEQGTVMLEDLVPDSYVGLTIPAVNDFYREVKQDVKITNQDQSVKIELIGVRI